MFTETSIDENVGEIKDEPSVADVDYGIGQLSVSPLPERAGESLVNMSMVLSDDSDDLLSSAFDFIDFDFHSEQIDDVAKDITNAEALGLVCEDGRYANKFDSTDSIILPETSTQRNAVEEISGEVEENHKSNLPLTVQTSSQGGLHSDKSNQTNKSQKTSRNRRRMAGNKSVVDLSSLQILRRKRSLFIKRGRSSVWGSVGHIFPDLEQCSGLNPNADNEKKPRKSRSAQRNRNATRDQKARKSTVKRCTPAGHISLKIKIGNQSCAIGNLPESFNALEKSIPVENTESKLGDKMPGDMLSLHKLNLEKIVSSGTCVLNTGIVENPSFGTSCDHLPIVSLEEGAPPDNICSDPGTSPDSEVINSAPDALSFEKGNQNNNLHQLHNFTMENKVTGRETPNDAELPAELTVDQKVGDVSYCTDAARIAAMNPSRESNCSKGVSRGPQRCSRVTDSGIYFTPSKVLNGAEMNSSSGLAAAEIESSNLRVCEALGPCSTGEKLPKFSTAEGKSSSRSRVLDLPRKKEKAAKKKGNKDNFEGSHQDNKAVEVSGAENNLTTGLQNIYDIGETGALGKDLSIAISSLQVSSSGERDQLVSQRNAWVLCDDCQKWRRIEATLADQIEETNRRWTCKDNTDIDFSDCSIQQEKSNSEINEELEISDASGEEDGCDTLQTSNQNRPKVAQQSSWSLIKSNLFLHRSRKKHAIDEVMVCHCKPPLDGRMGCGAECLNRMLNIECVRGTCPCGELCSNQQFQKRKYAKLKLFRCGKKGYGLQTDENISEGKFLIEYVGEVLDMRAYEARQREYALNCHKHFYFMTLNGSEIIDACAKGNLGRYINHSCDPNCRTEKWMVNGEVCVGLFALKDIKKGEEVTFDYNYVRVFGAAAKKCVCGSPNCRGYIGGDPTSSEIIVQGDSDDEFTEPVVICEDREMKSDWQDIMSNTLNDRENKIANKPLRNRHRMKKQVRAVGHLECIEETQTLEPSTPTEGINSTTVDGSLKTLVTPRVVESMAREENEADNAVGNDSSAYAVGRSDISKVAGESLNGSASASCKIDVEGCLSQMHSSSQVMDVSLQSDGIMHKDVPSVQQEFYVGQKNMANSLSSAHDLEMDTAVSPSKSLPDTVECKSKMKYPSVGGRDEPGKSNSLSKAHRSSSLLKKGKPKSNVLDDKGSPKQPELSLNSQSEAVEEKLNELLEPEGGISKRKDASKGYLKLLYLTAASGNNGHGEAIQSNRDLSMILDALLKTKSRTVLIDIINKNGLQMLHNIIKRYRKEFIKTPILRKLLKVLEYLAMRGILTLEHIARGPPYRGGESFTQAVLDLAEHNDKKVHQIARNFRDKWIPWSLRRNCCVERDDGRIESHQRSSYGRFPASYDLRNDRGGKPSETTDSREKKLATAPGTVEASTVDHSASVSSCVTNRIRTRKRKSRWDNPAEESLHSRIKTNLGVDGKPNVDDDDAPPGFPSPCNAPVVLSHGSSVINQQERVVCEKHQVGIVLGELQQRFIARLPVSYGIPSSIMKKFGSPASWTAAPGVPFLPFPPLPTYDKRDPPTSGARCLSFSEPAENAEQASDTTITHHAGQKHARTWGVDPPEVNATVANDRQDFQRPGGLGRKYFRQQKPNHSKLAPPWVRMRNGWGNNGRNGVGLGNGANDSWNSYNMEGPNWRGEF